MTIASRRSGPTFPSDAAKRSSSNIVTLPVIVESVASAIDTAGGISSTAAVAPNKKWFERGHQTSDAPRAASSRRPLASSPTPCTTIVPGPSAPSASSSSISPRAVSSTPSAR